jgi:hypothetical protein
LGRAAAYIAAGLAFASAATTAYWLFGGTALLDTLGGSVEHLARDRSTAAVALAATVVVIKSGAGVLALLLLSPAQRGWRMILALDILAAAACACGAGRTCSSARWYCAAQSSAQTSTGTRFAGTYSSGTVGFSFGELLSRWRQSAPSPTGTGDAVPNASHVDTCQATPT